MEESGAVVDELRIAGAMSGNDVLNQIKADITQKRVLVTQHKEAEQLGLAIVGSCALGKFPSFAEAAAGLVRIEKTFQPEGKNVALYEDLFGEYRRVREMG
jgi:sugar (pentulose or hexulose) kinase